MATTAILPGNRVMVAIPGRYGTATAIVLERIDSDGYFHATVDGATYSLHQSSIVDGSPVYAGSPTVTTNAQGNLHGSLTVPRLADERSPVYHYELATPEQEIERLAEQMASDTQTRRMILPRGVQAAPSFCLTPVTELLLAILLRPQGEQERAWADVLRAILAGDRDARLAAAAALADLVKVELEE